MSLKYEPSTAGVHAEVAGQEAEYDRKAGEVSHAAEVRVHNKKNSVWGTIVGMPENKRSTNC